VPSADSTESGLDFTRSVDEQAARWAATTDAFGGRPCLSRFVRFWERPASGMPSRIWQFPVPRTRNNGIGALQRRKR